MEMDELPLQHLAAMKRFSTLELATMIRARLNDPQSNLGLEQLLHLGIADIHSMFNSFRPATQSLPPEILSMVFHEASAVPLEGLLKQVMEEAGPSRLYEWETHDVPVFVRPWDITRDFQVLFRLSSVCKLWHRVIVQDPNLWTRVNGTVGDAIYHVVKRCKALPLRVHYIRHEDMRTLDPIRRHAYSYKFEELYMCSLSTHIPMRLDHTILSFPAFGLKRLAIDFWGVRDVGNWSQHPVLFKNCSPLLEELTLRRTLWLPANTWPNLTHLCIHNCGSREMSWNFTDMLIWLRGFPKLKELIVHAVHAQLPDDRTAGPAVPLHNLERLVLGELFVHATLFLLRCISIPPSCALRVDIASYLPWQAHLPDLFSLTGMGRFARLRISLGVRVVTVLALNDDTGTRLDLRLPDGAQRPADWAEALLEALPLDTVTLLWLEDLPLAELRALRAARAATCLALASSARGPDEQAAYRVLERLAGDARVLPRLGALSVHLACGAAPELRWALLALAKGRAACGAPLRQLRVTEGELAGEGTGGADAFAPYVAQVEWMRGPGPCIAIPRVGTQAVHRYWPRWSGTGLVTFKERDLLAKRAKERQEQEIQEDEAMDDASEHSSQA
ncbi:hypothetical protein CERSUDRAFT_81095 [Gelatoporia subvermispora B]|uniref:Uncharacterized protein n=1 Tax=Ceriporiopsis subvermispora (strain B) TaxID=914234 RepID=M2PSR5_CERS8|nr:hypothetical protein CERSUDRAFT_81095 [Gelatoporia subvermispora B]